MEITNNFLLLPKDTLDVKDILMDAGNDCDEAKKIIKITGISRLRYAQPRMLTEFIFDGLDAVFKKHASVFKNVDAVIVVSQSYDQRIPSISSRIQKKYNLNAQAFCMDIMDGCSGYIKALNLASMLGDNGFKKILILTGDLNSSMTSNSEIGTKILFGDGISLSILETSNTTLKTRLFNSGDQDGFISCSVNENLMNMNGFEVFRFTRKMIPPMIKSFLGDYQESLSDYDLLALHQASLLVVSNICQSLKFSNKLSKDFSCGEIGNLGAGSIGAWLCNINDLEKRGKLKMLAVGYGSGLSWGLASVSIKLQVNEVIYV